jgi:integrase
MARKRKKRRSDYVGASLSSHHGLLRIEWRDGSKRVTWGTGEPDTPQAREHWEPVRKLVGAYRAQGADPRPHLQRRETSRTPALPTVPTVRSYAAEWVLAKQGAIRPVLLRDYKQHLATYLLTDPIADVPFEALRPMDVALLQSRLRDRRTRTGTPLHEKTVQNIISGTLRALLRDATIENLVQRDLFAGITWKTWKVPPAQPLAGNEWDRIEHWFRCRTYPRPRARSPHPAFHAYVYFLRWHGARPSEGAALSWDDVDLRQGIAYVNHSFVLGSLGDPKTESARRSIELHPEMVTLLKAIRPLHPEPGAIVFPNLEGRRIRLETFSSLWMDCLQACRIRHRGIYCLKDTFVTEVLATAERTGEVGQLTAWLVRQTGVRLDTLKKHYTRWWPRDQAAIRRTYGLLDPSMQGKLSPGVGGNASKA